MMGGVATKHVSSPYPYKDRVFGESKITTVKIEKQKNPAAMLPGSF